MLDVTRRKVLSPPQRLDPANAWLAGAPVQEKIGVSVGNLKGVGRATFEEVPMVGPTGLETKVKVYGFKAEPAEPEDQALQIAEQWLRHPGWQGRLEAMRALQAIDPGLYEKAVERWLELTQPASIQADQQPNNKTVQTDTNQPTQRWRNLTKSKTGSCSLTNTTGW
jgi:hypothetical protein